METDLVAKVEQRIIEEKLADPGDVMVVAVSGGPDSVALLHVLFVLRMLIAGQLVVAHVNHQFRGAESDAEADFVAELAAGLGLPCEIGVIDVPAYIEEASLNGQAAAREKRYEFLHQVAAKYGAHRIAFAHHADDQAETMSDANSARDRPLRASWHAGTQTRKKSGTDSSFFTYIQIRYCELLRSA